MSLKYNKNAQKYTEEEAKEMFVEVLDNAFGDCLSVQEAFLKAKIPSSTYHHLKNKFQICSDIHEDVRAVLISKINRGSLEGDLISTPAIWRFKQLGETDKTEVTNYNYDSTPLTKEEIEKAKNKLEEDF